MLLALGIVAFYWVDSALYLSVNEAVVNTRCDVLRSLSFGSALELAGRRPYTPNPFTPFWPAFRIEWDMTNLSVRGSVEIAEEMRRHLRNARGVSLLSGACAIFIIIGAPTALVLGNGFLFLGAVALGFLSAIGSCVVIALKKTELGLNSRQVLSLALVALACLPCSANLSRAVASRRTWTLAARDLLDFGLASAESDSIRNPFREALVRARRFHSEDSIEFKVIDDELKRIGERAS